MWYSIRNLVTIVAYLVTYSESDILYKTTHKSLFFICRFLRWTPSWIRQKNHRFKWRGSFIRLLESTSNFIEARKKINLCLIISATMHEHWAISYAKRTDLISWAFKYIYIRETIPLIQARKKVTFLSFLKSHHFLACVKEDNGLQCNRKF